MNVAVVGASGHTGRFVVAELLKRGHTPVAVVRDLAKSAASGFRQVEARVASLDDSAALDCALAGARAVINCAGPFLDTAKPVVAAALRAGIHYFDVTAEQECVSSTLASFDAPARERGVVVLPALAFFGALGSLLASAACGDWVQADRVDIAIALDRWWPTAGTRNTGTRNTAPRVVLEGGTLVPMQPSEPRAWTFPEPFATQAVVEVPLSETILIASHGRVRTFHNYMNEAPLNDLSDSATPEPTATDERGRSSQIFIVDAIARKGEEARGARVRGRDIYATTAPIVVEAVERVCADAAIAGGAYAIASVLEATSFLRALDRRGDLTFEADAGNRDAL